LAWSLSFYPQPLLNLRRKSVTGTAIDFPTINVLGFFCYLVSTAAFLYSPVIREEYAVRNPVSPEPTVRGNDLAFAVHAMVLSALTWSMFFPMIWGLSVDGRRQRVSRTIAGVFLGSVLGLLAVVLIVWTNGGKDANGWAWIDVVGLKTCFD
jgi:cystinosin